MIRHALRTLGLVLAAATMTLGATSASGQSQDSPRTLESDIAALIADNAALREQLRKLEEQQKTMLEQVGRLASEQPAVSAPQTRSERYRDGIIIWATPDDVAVPFLLRLNNNTQVRYLNTLNSDDTFTDHLGAVRQRSRCRKSLALATTISSTTRMGSSSGRRPKALGCLY